MGRREYIYSYKHDFAFAGWLKFGCIGFERNAGLLAPCDVKDLMHGHCDFWHPTCLQGWASASSATSNEWDAWSEKAMQGLYRPQDKYINRNRGLVQRCIKITRTLVHGNLYACCLNFRTYVQFRDKTNQICLQTHRSNTQINLQTCAPLRSIWPWARCASLPTS